MGEFDFDVVSDISDIRPRRVPANHEVVMRPVPERSVVDPERSGPNHGLADVTNEKDATMSKTIIRSLTLLGLLALAPVLSACNTTAGAGQDISATGRAVTNTADKLKP